MTVATDTAVESLGEWLHGRGGCCVDEWPCRWADDIRAEAQAMLSAYSRSVDSAIEARNGVHGEGCLCVVCEAYAEAAQVCREQW